MPNEDKRQQNQLAPDQEHKQTDQEHAPGLQAASKVLHRISQLYDNGEQNPYPDLCEIELALTNFSKRSVEQTKRRSEQSNYCI